MPLQAQAVPFSRSPLRDGSGAGGPDADTPTAILISGMHRSGTSALARTLSLLGASLPEDLVPANAGNPHGHWEPSGMVALNDRMLADAESDIYSAVEIHPDWFTSPAAKLFETEAADFARRSISGDIVVLKDPRTALLAPIWNQALSNCGYRVVHVIPLRHPVDVADSLRRRHLKDFPYDAWVSPRGEAVWLRYMLASIRGAQGHAKVFVRYSDLLSDWRSVAGRISSAMGRMWTRDVSDASVEVQTFLHANARSDSGHVRRAKSSTPDALTTEDLAGELYHCLCDGDETGIAAVEASFLRRMAGTRDLIVTLEGLYPVVWRFYQEAESAQQRLGAASLAEADIRANLQRTWVALTRANSDKLALQQTVDSQEARIRSIDGELAQHRAAIAAEQARAAADEAERTRLADALQRAELGLGAAEVRISAMERSTSWRLAAPLRLFARTFLGRS
ncbi:sulfotransferase family protein [Lichenifustis flavocetrariae]|uniref:Sulfotransferase family protein n=1 Tax=Lichenifustis flavocetrariae TaxID=2949735 RepID=A0AA41Z1T2_9HYPH|nr:hypothetical protein [Lichenifustis flavocetrariae]MCW6511422.1 hypothetical protein [Lichenifustis flavocetrariae]